MKKLLIGFLLLFASTAQAETVGPGCSFAWGYAQPLPANVDGFRLYLNGIQVWEGAELTATCAAAGLALEGEHQVWVTAFNAASESESSNILTFYYVSGAPAAPTTLRFQH